MIAIKPVPSAERRRWISLAIVCIGQLMIVLDATIVNVALPSMQHDLHFSQANLSWVVDAYMIAFGSYLLLAGRLGDLLGRKRTFLTGLAMFTLASVACGLANDQVLLIMARFVQGLGGAVASAAVLVPIRIATFLLGRALISETESQGLGQRVDVLGPLLVTVSLMLGVYAIVKAADDGWLSAHTLGLGGASLALLSVFAAVESRLANPMFPPAIARVPGLAASSVVRGFLVTGMFSTFLLGVLYLQHVHGYGALNTGLASLPLTLVLGLLSVGITARLMARFGPLRVLLAGLTAIAVALVLLSRLSTHANYLPTILAPLALLGFGAGLSFLPLTTIAMANVPIADAGLASGIVNASLQISGAIGIAAVGTIAAERTKVLAGRGQHHLQALTGGFHLAWALGAGAVGAGALIALLSLRQPDSPAEAEAMWLSERDRLALGGGGGVMERVTHIERHRSLGQSRWRKALRVRISRRRDVTRTGHVQFVSQARFGKQTAHAALQSAIAAAANGGSGRSGRARPASLSARSPAGVSSGDRSWTQPRSLRVSRLRRRIVDPGSAPIHVRHANVDTPTPRPATPAGGTSDATRQRSPVFAQTAQKSLVAAQVGATQRSHEVGSHARKRVRNG